MPSPRASVGLVIALLVIASRAAAQDADGRIAEPLFPTPALPAAVEMGHAEPEARPFERHFLAVQVLLGLEVGVRAQVEFIHLGRLSVMFEAQAGFEYIVIPSAGAGVRLGYRVYQGQSDAFVIAPGIDFLWPIQTHGSIVTRTDLVLLAATIDFSWVQEFAPHFATELGAQLGADVPLASSTGGWLAIPQFSVFAGVRF